MKLFHILFLVVLMALSANYYGCSHKNPYYRIGTSEIDQTVMSESSLVERLILIGDAGETVEDDPVLSSLYQWCIKEPRKTHVLFLGDNIYSDGLDEENSKSLEKAKNYLLTQLSVVQRSGAQATFIPGNHDWGKGGERGRRAIIQQQEMVEEILQHENAFLPKNGCPGPVFLDTKTMRLIILDTDHWINDNIDWPADCPSRNKHEYLANIQKLLQTSGECRIAVLAHHPLDTYGTHGGFFDWQDHIFPLTRGVKWLYFPLPIIGSLYPLGRKHIIKSNQDLVGANYKEMVEALNEVLKENKPLFYAAGHDHSLQVMEGESVDYILVSGAGSIPRIMPVGDAENTLFAHSHPGFMVLDILADERVKLQVIEPPDGKVVYTTFLVAQ